jgi:hypothetical protein
MAFYLVLFYQLVLCEHDGVLAVSNVAMFYEAEHSVGLLH